MVWLYFAVAVAAASGACLVAWLLRSKPAKRVNVAWVGIVVGFACYYLVLAMEGEYIPLIVGIGTTCVAAALLILIVSKRVTGTGGQ